MHPVFDGVNRTMIPVLPDDGVTPLKGPTNGMQFNPTVVKNDTELGVLSTEVLRV